MKTALLLALMVLASAIEAKTDKLALVLDICAEQKLAEAASPIDWDVLPLKPGKVRPTPKQRIKSLTGSPDYARVIQPRIARVCRCLWMPRMEELSAFITREELAQSMQRIEYRDQRYLSCNQ